MKIKTSPQFVMRPLSGVRVAYVILIHLGALLALYPEYFSWGAVLAAFVMHFLTGAFGISIGLHRTLTHRAAIFPKWIERLFVTMAVFDIQKPITWVAVHRLHHGHQGTDKDPHSANNGFYWAHIRWFLSPSPENFDPKVYAPDVAADPYYAFLEKYHLLVFLLSLLALWVIGGVSWVIWAGFMRLVIVGHSTWAVNSLCHIRINKLNINTENEMQLDINRSWLALITYGEGLHKNHHDQPANPIFFKTWKDVDVGGYILNIMHFIGLVKFKSQIK
jgi:fatty-acid desaturase